MQEDNQNLTHTVSLKIVAQLKEMTDAEQQSFITTLLDHLNPFFVQALDFAYEMTPNQKRGSKAEQPYTCNTCGKSLTFPQTLFYQDKPYCFEHIPEYQGRKSEGW